MKPVLVMSATRPSIIALVSIRIRSLCLLERLGTPVLVPVAEMMLRNSRSRSRPRARPRTPKTPLRVIGRPRPSHPSSRKRGMETKAATARPAMRPTTAERMVEEGILLVSSMTLRRMARVKKGPKSTPRTATPRVKGTPQGR